MAPRHHTRLSHHIRAVPKTRTPLFRVESGRQSSGPAIGMDDGWGVRLAARGSSQHQAEIGGVVHRAEQKERRRRAERFLPIAMDIECILRARDRRGATGGGAYVRTCAHLAATVSWHKPPLKWARAVARRGR